MIPMKAADANALVQAASPVAMEGSLRTVRIRLRRWERWLNNQHKYGKDVVGLLKADTDIDGPKIGEYIACSAPLHLADGWNYLSRAFEAATRGDRGTACHLAYYAELRGAMSLLATQGIGIFASRHIALDSQMYPTVFRGEGTHKDTWRILEAWSNETTSARRLLEAITLHSRRLSEWLGDVGVVTQSQGVLARDWLQAWSVDLGLFDLDRNRRNEASYRPSRIRSQDIEAFDPVVEVVHPLFQSWEQLEPSTVGAKAALDVSLLREAISHATTNGLCNYASLESALMALKHAMPVTLHDALTSSSEGSNAFFREAAVNQDARSAATPILARALLILRLASAHTAALLSDAEISKSDLEFWWSSLGTELGFWDAVADIENLADLWIEVSEARDEANSRIGSLPDGAPVRVVTDILARNLPLTQFSRAPFWLLGLE